MDNKSLTFQVHPDDITIDTSKKDLVKIDIHNNMAISIGFDNDVLLRAEGDFVVAAKGEINFISDGEPICIDSINSEIHLNSREGKWIKDLPESIEYRQYLLEKSKRNIQIATMQEMQNKTLKERVSVLENQLEDIGNILKEFVNSIER